MRYESAQSQDRANRHGSQKTHLPARFSCLRAKEPLIKLIPFMVRQAHHERNQQFTVRPEPVEGLDQRFLNWTLDFVARGMNVSTG